MAPTATRRILAIVPDVLDDREPIDEVRGRAAGEDGVEVRVVVPAVEENALRHAMGDVDEPARQARRRLDASLDALRRNGVTASGTVGDPDPVLAAQDALREGPADEILIFEHAGGEARWFENGLFERAREELEPPLRLVVVEGAAGVGGAHVVDVEKVAAGTRHDGESEVEIPVSHNMPEVPRGDFAGMAMGIVGTIIVAVLAGAGPGPDSSWGAASILIAIATALVNMAHVVGLTLFESVRYHGGWAKFFRGLALVGTPAAIVANLLILLFA